ncbi:MAG TPA: hypothetical protein VLW50_00420 [Streptosporangiaceae bacterium]|nr:hypothetical protein [Streptosporangiaceae bacterium]
MPKSASLQNATATSGPVTLRRVGRRHRAHVDRRHHVVTARVRDIVVDSGAGMSGAIDEGLTRALNTLLHVASATGKTVGPVKISPT